MDREFVYYILFLNIVVAIVYFVKKNNEIPFFLALFNLFVEYRVISLEAGYSQFVSYDYGIDFINNLDYAYIASNLILLGSSVMMYSYILFFKIDKKQILDNNLHLKEFVTSKNSQILMGLVFFSLLALVLKGGRGGYANLISFGNSSFILMLFLIVFFLDKRKSDMRFFYGIIFLLQSFLTYSTGGRFQFLGWIIPIAFFFARNITPIKKAVFGIVGIFLLLILFSLAGVLRYRDASTNSAESLYEASLERLKVAEDVNFIDGFMMIYQVYPALLPYEYGLQHIEILLRPIPRSLWPGKPQASWVRKYQQKYTGEVLESAGFSPTVWGVFYAEIGTGGIVFFSVVWAWMLAYLYQSFSRFRSDLSYILVGVLLASLIPIFRSGDMAGDFAIVLMSYWPLIVFVQQYKAFLKKKRVRGL